MLSDKGSQGSRAERKCSAGACPPLPAPAGDKPLHYRTGYQHVRAMARGHAHLPQANFPRTVLGHLLPYGFPSPEYHRQQGRGYGEGNAPQAQTSQDQGVDGIDGLQVRRDGDDI